MERLIELFSSASPEKNFIDNFKTCSVKNMKQGLYIIWKIERYLGNSVKFKPKNQSAAQHLEFIMPRKPSSDWDGMEKQENFNTHLNRVGNLLILTKEINQHIKNKGFKYKVKNMSNLDYSSSELEIVQEFVAKFDNWTKQGRWDFDSITERQDYLAHQYASQVWPLQRPLLPQPHKI
jgi:hypothetical protein